MSTQDGIHKIMTKSAPFCQSFEHCLDPYRVRGLGLVLANAAGHAALQKAKNSNPTKMCQKTEANRIIPKLGQ